jgi:hypothetical protein
MIDNQLKINNQRHQAFQELQNKMILVKSELEFKLDKMTRLQVEVGQTIFNKLNSYMEQQTQVIII